jgi:EmrB/QacA subfamily drug resistance transporter
MQAEIGIAGGVAGPGAAPVARAALIAATVACGNFLTALDQNIVTTALPQMAQSFHRPPEQLSMAITSYALGMAMFVPVSGWAADRFGARGVYAGAVLLFTIASVLCGMAPSLATLSIARALQGLGAAMMVPVGQMVVLQSFPKHRLMRVNNHIQLAVILGPMAAPLIGGYLTQTFGWSWIFYVNVPVGIVTAAMAWRLFGAVDAHGGARRFDARGFVLVAGAVLLFQVCVDSLNGAFLSGPATAVLFLSALVLGTLFVRHARRVEEPLLDLDLLRVRTFRIPYVTSGMCDGLGICAMIFLLPMLLQVGFGMTPIESGSRTSLVMVGALLMRGFVPALLARLGFRRMLLGCTVICAAVVASFALMRADTPDWLLGAAMLAFGMMRTAQFFSSTNLAYSDIPVEKMSRFAPLATVIGQLEISTSIALAAALLALFAGSGPVTAAHFPPVFAIAGLAVLCALYGYAQLRPGDGAQVSGDRSGTAPLIHD